MHALDDMPGLRLPSRLSRHGRDPDHERSQNRNDQHDNQQFDKRDAAASVEGGRRKAEGGPRSQRVVSLATFHTPHSTLHPCHFGASSIFVSVMKFTIDSAMSPTNGPSGKR